MTSDSVLPDGEYEAMVIDATDGDGGAVELEVTVLAGAHRGGVVTIRATGLGRDSIDLLAVPATMTVQAGRPTIRLEG